MCVCVGGGGAGGGGGVHVCVHGWVGVGEREWEGFVCTSAIDKIPIFTD